MKEGGGKRVKKGKKMNYKGKEEVGGEGRGGGGRRGKGE